MLSNLYILVAASAVCIRNAVALRDSCYMPARPGVSDVLGLPGLLMGDNFKAPTSKKWEVHCIQFRFVLASVRSKI